MEKMRKIQQSKSAVHLNDRLLVFSQDIQNCSIKLKFHMYIIELTCIISSSNVTAKKLSNKFIKDEGITTFVFTRSARNRIYTNREILSKGLLIS